MKRFLQRFKIRFGLRTLIAITILAALMISLIIVPEMRRTSTFRQLNDYGVVIHAPRVVMFGGPQPIAHITPEPEWHAFRQRINNLIGITTVPWYPDGELDVPRKLEATITDLIRDLDDLRSMREWDVQETRDNKTMHAKPDLRV